MSDVGDSVVYTARAAGLPAVLASGAASTTVPVVLRASRCDPHRLVDSRRTYRFPVAVRAGGSRTSLVVVPDEPAKALLDRLLQQTCARRRR